jgi:hypothetical protein
MLKHIKPITDENGLIFFELALVLPILLLIVFGILQLSFIYNARMVTAYATYVGARESAIGGDADDSRDLTEIVISSLDLKTVIPGMSDLVLDTDFVKNSTFVEAKVTFKLPVRMPMVQRIFSFLGSLLGFPFKEVGCYYKLQRE